MNDKELVLSLQEVETEAGVEPEATITIVTTVTTTTSFWSTVSNHC